MAGPAFIESTRAHIDAQGWAKLHVRAVQGDPTSPIAYTISVGLDEKFGLPELLVFGLKEDTINPMFDRVITQLQAQGGWSGGPTRLNGVLDNLPVEVRAIDPDYIGKIFSHNIIFRKLTARPELTRAAQIFWPGRDGLFPWDADAQDDFYDQPRLDIPGAMPT